MIRGMLKDRIVVTAVAIGMSLMAVTIWGRLNPFEGSITDPLFKNTDLGSIVGGIVSWACGPAWVAGLLRQRPTRESSGALRRPRWRR